MQILLSHAVGADDEPIASRLKAVTAAYGVRLLLPARDALTKKNTRGALPVATRDAIAAADVVVALVTAGASTIDHVQRELHAAVKASKPIVAVVEGDLELPATSAQVHVVHFRRDDPSAHEEGLLRALNAISGHQRTKAARARAQQASIAVGALVGIAVGLLALRLLAPPDEQEPQVMVR